MLKSANVATPATAATESEPERVPGNRRPPLWPMAIATCPVKVVATFPKASDAVTCTGGEIVPNAAVLVGCTVNESCVAAPGVMSNELLVAPVSPLALAASVYPEPALSILRFENVATPFAAPALVVPDRVPPPALVPMATVMLPLNPVAVFP